MLSLQLQVTRHGNGLPLWLSGKEFACQCRRYRFYPWVGKIPWRRKWRPTQVFLPGKSYEQKSLVGYQHRGRKELDTTQQPSTHADIGIFVLNYFFHHIFFKNLYSLYSLLINQIILLAIYLGQQLKSMLLIPAFLCLRLSKRS